MDDVAVIAVVARDARSRAPPPAISSPPRRRGTEARDRRPGAMIWPVIAALLSLGPRVYSIGLNQGVTTVDIEKASEFMRPHARLLDRRRFELLFGDGSVEAPLRRCPRIATTTAVGFYGARAGPSSASSYRRGASRSRSSRARSPETSEMAVRLCDWLDSASRRTARCRSHSRWTMAPAPRRSGQTPTPPSHPSSSPAPSRGRLIGWPTTTRPSQRIPGSSR